MAKQSGGNTAQRVEALVRPTVEGMGLRLWDVVLKRKVQTGIFACSSTRTAPWIPTPARMFPMRWTPSLTRQTPSTRVIIWKWAAPALAVS